MICRRILKKPSFIRLCLFSFCEAVEKDFMFYAASVAYYTLMSIIPLFVFIISLALITFHVNIESLIPREILESPLKPFFDQVKRLVETSGFVSSTAVLVMLWFSRGIFLSVERAFCEILGRENPAGFFYKNFAVILSIFILWVLMILFYIMKYLILLLFPSTPIVPFISSVSIILMLFSILFNVYFFLLPVKFPVKIVLKVSAFVLFMLMIFERVFVWFIVNVSKVNIIYGSFAALVIFLLWIYYSATMVLIGAGILKGKMILEGEDEADKVKA
jgi:membrane protein